MIAIVDYGMGNVRSVERALQAVGAQAKITRDHDELREADGLVLPGVGAFGVAMSQLRSAGIDSVLEERVLGERVPFLGICLGMQLICRESHEHGLHRGLGWIDAAVERLDARGRHLRIPHIGWNDTSPSSGKEVVLAPSVFYFVHSYRVSAEHEATAAVCSYGEPFAAALACDNIWATQFHPEKSQADGLDILRRFSARTVSTLPAA